jgi:hypothetical protein
MEWMAILEFAKCVLQGPPKIDAPPVSEQTVPIKQVAADVFEGQLELVFRKVMHVP